jgi:hypothetical protein
MRIGVRQQRKNFLSMASGKPLGFSLVEAACALGVLSLVFGAGALLVHRSVRLLRTHQDQLQAARTLLERKLGFDEDGGKEAFSVIAKSQLGDAYGADFQDLIDVNWLKWDPEHRKWDEEAGVKGWVLMDQNKKPFFQLPDEFGLSEATKKFFKDRIIRENI